MDPAQLIGPQSQLGYPAPYWFMATFKVLGFTLHMVPMHLWLAGTAVAMILRVRGGEEAGLYSHRLMNQMPIVIALGINFGIVPLLFIQTAYYQVFFPATILMAWPWFSIFVMTMLAYFGIYMYAVGLRTSRLTGPVRLGGWAAALLFVMVSFVFANGFSLMTNIGAWPGIWQRSSVAGAPLGLGLNTGDPTLLPRWLMLLGLALTTVAVYAVVDAGLLAHRAPGAYRRWASRFAPGLYTLGAVWFAAAGTWYVFGTWVPEARAAMFSGPAAILTALTALAPGLPWLLLVFLRRRLTASGAVVVAAAQVGVLALNAMSRQVLQNVELRRFADITAQPVNLQLSPLVVFLALFIAGLGVIGWMVGKALEARRQVAGS